MIRSLVIVLFLLTKPLLLQAQETEVIIKGKVMDAKTGQGIPVVRISSSLERVSSNEQGGFTIKAKMGDQLSFVHLTYETAHINVKGNDEDLEIVLAERVLELREFEVSDFPSEQAFKEAMMNSNLDHAKERKMLQNNLKTVMIAKDLTYQHDFSSYNTLLKNVNTGGGVTFFSTNPSHGLLGALKKIINGKPRNQTLGNGPIEELDTRPLWKNPLEVDSFKFKE
ncbi:carboxypeptidase-like regulatory domain-containing protein [Echinicola shivajiensis]|uniref:carboxypeptidase-like regulatory domain-containing protein n=1 Tax=Echinicola shivajiensis TaxID=1035916 RepID=UPI001BFC7047|nr:carboxypeptidase-like regulatory domain-containing protein [Echinicola shivajiensis]